MSAQFEASAQIVEDVAGCGVPVGLFLGGSVALGCERLDSDLDFFAIGEAGLDLALEGFVLFNEKNGSKLLDRSCGDFPVHIAYWTKASFEQVLATKPYMTYPLLQSRIVHDPAGIAIHYLRLVEGYFADHPAISLAWEEQLKALRLFKSGQIPTLHFSQWSDFLRHLESTLLS